METLKLINYSYLESDLNNHIKEFLAEAKEFIKENDYHLSNESAEALKQMNAVLWKSYLGNATKNQKKKFIKAFNRFRKKRSRQTVNRAFHFIYTRLLAKREIVKYTWYSYEKWTNPEFIKKVKVQAPIKHQVIQQKRKEWKTAQAEADRLLAEYKEEKGDYYKNGGKV